MLLVFSGIVCECVGGSLQNHIQVRFVAVELTL